MSHHAGPGHSVGKGKAFAPSFEIGLVVEWIGGELVFEAAPKPRARASGRALGISV
jgi:hypothetical protein